MRTNANLRLEQKLLPALYGLLILGYCVAYAPFGLDNNDGGFILGLAFQYFSGSEIYKDIVYIRPPVSILLHSIAFHPPFDFAPILASRVFFYFQIGVYSWAAAYFCKCWFNFPAADVYLVSALSFIFSAHNVTPMPWHTVDGVFFSALAFTLIAPNQRYNLIRNIVAYTFGFLAALSKQPFYILPLLLWIFIFLKEDKNRLTNATIPLIGSFLLTLFLLSNFVDLERMASAISSQTRLRDLVSAGLVAYLRDILNLSSFIFAAPTAIALLIKILIKSKTTTDRQCKLINVFTTFSIVWLFVGIAKHFASQTAWSSPQSIIDGLFVFTGLASAWLALKERSVAWTGVLLLHLVAWASSISWGYTTSIFFSAPAVIVLYLKLFSSFGTSKLVKSAAFMLVIASAGIFWTGHRYHYSLEGPAKREQSTVHLGEQFPRLNGIFSTQERLDMYLSTQELLRELRGGDILVAPNIPLFHAIFDQPNLIGVDWLLNAEIGPYQKEVKERIEKQILYALVYKKASPRPEKEGRFGSFITAEIIESWTPLNLQNEHFLIYQNPKSSELAGRIN